MIRPFALEITLGDFALAGYRSIGRVAGRCMQRRPFHSSSPALTSTNPDTRRRAVEYRQMVRSIWSSPATGIKQGQPLPALSPLMRPRD
jgi:hypothetical protein